MAWRDDAMQAYLTAAVLGLAAASVLDLSGLTPFPQ
jgi:hypothetical protein